MKLCGQQVGNICVLASANAHGHVVLYVGALSGPGKTRSLDFVSLASIDTLIQPDDDRTKATIGVIEQMLKDAEPMTVRPQ